MNVNNRSDVLLRKTLGGVTPKNTYSGYVLSIKDILYKS